MADHREIINALRDAIEAETAVADLLGAGFKQPREGWPRSTPVAPLITWRWTQTPSAIEKPGVDAWAVQVHIFAKRASTCRQISAALQEYFTIPGQLPAGVSSTNYRLTRFRLLSSTEMPGTVRPDKELGDLVLTVQQWAAHTRKRTSN